MCGYAQTYARMHANVHVHARKRPRPRKHARTYARTHKYAYAGLRSSTFFQNKSSFVKKNSTRRTALQSSRFVPCLRFRQDSEYIENLGTKPTCLMSQAVSMAMCDTITMHYFILSRVRLIISGMTTAGLCYLSLWKRVWSQHGIKVSTKYKVYKAIVLPILVLSGDIHSHTVATLENFPKCISHIYDKSCGSHGKNTFQMLKC